MGADACPVPEGKRSWLWFIQKLTTEAPVNGGCNSDSPKVNLDYVQLTIKVSLSLALVKPN